ncbi:MAG: NADH-quinone oxidoreductase subunit J [Nitrospirae bacterium]|nr:NADH-quinone oxidoreductase subunit J [Candidatus Manganitrophaceae bacterium]
MLISFYITGAVAVAATLLMVMSPNAVHALLYLIVSLLAVALLFSFLGAPFVAALEVIVYAGAIMVLFIFVVMMLNLGQRATEQERRWLRPAVWIGPSILAAVLIAEVVYLLTQAGLPSPAVEQVDPKAVSRALFGPYLIGVELASILLMGALVGAYHLGWHKPKLEMADDVHSRAARTASGGAPLHRGADRPVGSA